MPTSTEVELPRPLDGEEIKIGITHKIAEAIMASLDKHCALYGKAYPKFSAKWRIEYSLDNYGETRQGVVQSEILPTEPMQIPADFVLEGIIEETPPNLLRRETNQAIPTQIIDERGRQTEKAVFYKPRTGKPIKVR